MKGPWLKEQLVFYYMKRSLEAYPGITPFDGLASGVSALVQHLPAGKSIHTLLHTQSFEKAKCGEVMSLKDFEYWKNWQGDSEPCKKIIELLMQLISLVLPELMKLLAQLIIQLPKDGQNIVIDELYALVAESDDVTRKPTLVSWLQSLSYLCSQSTAASEACTEVPRIASSFKLQNATARL
ncbi:HTH-type transcriptional regulator ArgP [Bienertia sinuspersici]